MIYLLKFHWVEESYSQSGGNVYCSLDIDYSKTVYIAQAQKVSFM